MKFWNFAWIMAATFVLAAHSALAQPIEEKNLLSGKTKIAPNSGYIYLSGSTRQFGYFLKVPDTQDMADYTKEREEELKKAQAKYVKALKQWEIDRDSAVKRKMNPPPKPVEPTLETFSNDYIQTRNLISFGPESVFKKDKAPSNYSYMMTAKPGTYIYYGPVALTQNGYVGLCYCMGSVQFDVKAGMITDLGNFLTAAPDRSLQKTVGVKAIIVPHLIGSTRIDPNAVVTEAVRFGLPQSLGAYPSARADFRAAGKVDNFFGVTVSRLPPVAGVLGYARDKVVDLKLPAGSRN